MHLLPILLLFTFASAAPFAEQAVDLFQRRHALQELQRRQATTSTDPCGRLVGYPALFYPSEILACMRTISFKPEVRSNIMAVANAMYTQLDVLAYNQLGDTEPSVNQGVNIQTEFQRINSTTYASDYDFQFDLSRSLQLLNDGHHAWSSCYRGLFTTTHGIPIVSLSPTAESATPDIYIVPDIARFVSGYGLTTLYSRLGIDVASLAGAQVLTIEGKPAAQYIEEDKLPVTGTYIDKQQRLNSVFASYSGEGGLWSRTRGRFISTRAWDKDNLTMSVKTTAGVTKSVTVPWLVDFAGTGNWNYTTGESFWNAQCSTARPIRVVGTPAPANTTQTTNRTVAASEAGLTALARSAYIGCPIARIASSGISVVASEDPTRSSAYLGGRDVMFFKLPNTNTGVVVLSTFSPEPDTDPCYNRFMVDLVFGLRNLTAAGVQNILIDTSNNPGGFTALSQVAQVLFTGQRFENEANFETVLRRSPLSEAILQRFIDTPSLAGSGSPFNPAGYRVGTTQLARNANYFSPGRTYSLNGQTLRTSNLLRDDTSQIQALERFVNINDTAPFAPQNIVFTGNGLCGSACASFTGFLIEYYNGTGYIQAAQPSQPIEFEGFAAGQAMTTDVLYRSLANIGFNNSALLPPLNHAGTFGFALRASISPNVAPGDFLQYRSFPAAARFALTKETYSDQLAYWAYVASKAFPRSGISGGTNTGGTGGTARSGGGEAVGPAGWKRLAAAMGIALWFLVSW